MTCKKSGVVLKKILVLTTINFMAFIDNETTFQQSPNDVEFIIKYEENDGL